MLNQKDVAMVYEMMLASPGMSEHVKIGLNLPRKAVLVLTRIIEAGMAAKGEGDKTGLLAMVDDQLLHDLAEVNGELLQKAGLKEMSERINSLLSKQPS
ncbi:hypothetical protein [Paraflavitalea pollutisoli]|uniref:hypothetical protein n=1 Tax=Paraflavitalea pollutisoli TaxID=3034143 RepID=UPI0023EE1B1B|nr:hypothetical protein [Paraflavitalea sp. H1-2-19X]